MIDSKKRQWVVAAWWIGSGVLAGAWLSVPLWWRSDGLAYLLILPLVAVSFAFVVVLIVLMLQTGCFGLRRLLLGLAVLALAVAGSVSLDLPVRRWLFASSYGDYQSLARQLIGSPPATGDPRRQFSGAQRELAGVYAGSVESPNGSLIVRFETPAGPSLETTLFSTVPMTNHEGPLEPVRRDGLGYWYLVLRG